MGERQRVEPEDGVDGEKEMAAEEMERLHLSARKLQKGDLIIYQ